MISTIFKFLSKHLTIFLVGGLILAVMYGWHQRNEKLEAIEEVQKQKNNISALTDSVRTYRNKAGELGAQKLALQVDKKQLKEINEDLSNELQKERDKVEQITKAFVEIKNDTTTADTTFVSPVNNQFYRINWSKDQRGDGWSKTLAGFVRYKPDSTGAPTHTSAKITEDRLHLQLVTGITEKDGQRQIFVRSTYPNLRVTQLDGAIIRESELDKSQDNLIFGPQIGFGHNGQRFTPYLGVGITYKLFGF